MRHLDAQMDHLDAQLEKIDLKRIERQAERATKISGAKIAREVEENLKKIDWNRLSHELSEVKRIDISKMKDDMERLKTELSEQKLEVNIDLAKIKQDVNKAMEEARVSIEKAKVEIQLMKEFTDELDKDGLINKNKPFKIAVKEGDLYIDDKKQPKEVSDKYRKYYKKENFTINSDGRNHDGVAI
jgi:hypothetical protein